MLSTLSLVAACGSSVPATESGSSSSSAPPVAAARLDDDACLESPPNGRIDRGAHDLQFHTGGIRVAVGDAAPAAGDAPPTSAVASGVDDACYGFSRWGNPAPEVPPDSLLFVFTGPGTDGAQIEFLAGELTGGVLPPIGTVRPRVGPLIDPLGAEIGVSVDGAYYHATSCPLAITAMSSARAAGSFTCPTATRRDANPFAPDDDVSFDADESTPAPAAVSLSGWFAITP